MSTTQNPKPKTQNPHFITFEGGEGAGKSTQVKLLTEAFKQAALKVETTREPGGTAGAEDIRNLLVNGDASKWDAPTELLLHIASRIDHINKLIKPSLAKGHNVICDRFTDSTIAYQAYGHGLGTEFVANICNLAIGNFQPDLTILLDMPAEHGISRAGTRGEAENRYEKMGVGFHSRVHKGFLEIAAANPQRCVVINADSDINSVHKQVLTTVNTRLGINLDINSIDIS